MKYVLFACLCLAIWLPAVRAEEKSLWLTDFEAAKSAAAERGVPILVDFTGSDWCGWCIRLKAEVFSQAAFSAYARENLVLLELDFPMRTQLPEALREQNEGLRERFRIRGFPTILLLDAKGEELARTGYRRGGPEAYVEHLKELLAPAVAPDAAAVPEEVPAEAKEETGKE
ncbi:MAG: thioredoxin family protein [Kiritimatiellia bacterium]